MVVPGGVGGGVTPVGGGGNGGHRRRRTRRRHGVSPGAGSGLAGVTAAGAGRPAAAPAHASVDAATGRGTPDVDLASAITRARPASCRSCWRHRDHRAVAVSPPPTPRLFLLARSDPDRRRESAGGTPISVRGGLPVL